MINIRYGKNISFVWVITLNGQEVDLSGHTVQVELTLPNNNKVIIKPTVDYNILTFDYQGHNVGRHFLTCYLDRNTQDELMCDDKYGFNLVAQSWMEDDSLHGDVQTESITLSWNISADAASKGWVKAQQYLNARDLEDYDFATKTELNEGLDTKQDKLTAGENITISGNTISAKDTKYTAGANVQINGTVISATDTNTTYSAGTGLNLNGTTFSVDNTIATKTDLNAKQDKLTAGNNITISGNTISAKDTTYTAGTNVQINNKVISATDTKYTAGTGLTLTGTQFKVDNTIATKTDLNAKQDKLTAGENITIDTNNVISSTGGGATYTASVPLSIDSNDNISIDLSDYATQTDLSGKQDALTAGDNIQIRNNEISATDTTYSAGNGLNLVGTQFSVDTATIATKTDLNYKQDTLTAGNHIDITNNVIDTKGLVDMEEFNSALLGKQDVLTAGTNITINNDTISATDTTYSAGNGLSLSGTEFAVDTTTIATKSDLSAKQDTLTAGTNITINNDTISATDTTYTAGTGISIDANNVISATGGGDVPYEEQYLTFVALADGTFSFTRTGTTADVYYSIDNGTTWTVLASGTATPTVTTGNKILWKSDRTSDTFSNSNYITFNSSANFNAEGNVMSIIYGEYFDDKTSLASKDYVLYRLFYECTNVVDANNLILPATTLGNRCYLSSFYRCTSLVHAPELPATTLADNCYSHMFDGCTSLGFSPKLPATTLTSNCYSYMFNGCTSLVFSPKLPATTLTSNCYSRMFAGCSSLIDAPELPAMTLAFDCYAYMFQNCTSLAKAPELPATTLTTRCYFYMFNGCTSLTTAPDLPALSNNELGCYSHMFDGCSNLNYVKVLATTQGFIDNAQEWLKNTAATGICVKNTNALWTTTGDSGVPTGWTVQYADTGYVDKTPTNGSVNSITSDGVYDALQTKQDTLTAGTNITISSGTISATDTTYTAGDGIEIDANNVISATGGSGDHDYSKDYLTFVALEDGTFAFTRPGTTADVYYSIDNGTTWTVLESDTETPTVTTGNKILWKSDRTSDTFSDSDYNMFYSTGQFDAEGNVMSMLYGDNFEGQIDLTGKDYALVYLFGGCDMMIDASNLILPATTLAEGCYEAMFDLCTSLTIAPALPATTLTSYCYANMFHECTSLTTAPELPATTLAEYCYQYMFQGCTSLTKAPILPATTLASNCYKYMFYNCSSLNYIKAMFTTTPSNAYTSEWVSGVSATGTFVKNVNATWSVTGYRGVPTGWTVIYEETGYVDKTPTSGSNNTITSDGVKTYVDTQVGNITNILATI